MENKKQNPKTLKNDLVINLTKREYFAGLVFQALLPKGLTDADTAVILADKLIKALNEN